MVSLYDLTIGKDIEFKRILAEAGLDDTLVESIIKQPHLATSMIAALRQQLLPPSPRLFVPVQTVYDAFLARSDARNWDIGMGAKNRLWYKIQRLGSFASTLSNVFSLDIWLGDFSTTIDELWLWIKETRTNVYWRKINLPAGANSLQFTEVFAKSGRYGEKPFVQSVAIDLSANLGKVPLKVRAANYAGFELMTAFAVHPNYPGQISNDLMLGVWIGAFEARLYSPGIWNGVPFLAWNQANLELKIDARDVLAYPNFAVPLSRKL